MDLESNLIESIKRKQRGGWKASIAAVGVHGLIIGFILFMTATTTHKVNAEDHPIRAFMVSSAAPPPPPPPPPPAPAGTSHPAVQQVIKPVEIPKTTFVQPHEVPKEVPKVQPTLSTSTVVDNTPSQPSAPAGEAGGVPGGVAGGVQGGVEGGVVGGQVGGQVGGVLGGTPGGVVGGTVGGTGSDKDAAPAPPPPPAPAAPDGPMRVGGDVKAPVVVKRVEPQYTETARKGHITGVVILEAIINKDGEVEQVHSLKGLPLGLTEKAEEAVKEWRFKPGTLNGDPVPVIFDLTVNFTMQ